MMSERAQITSTFVRQEIEKLEAVPFDMSTRGIKINTTSFNYYLLRENLL